MNSARISRGAGMRVQDRRANSRVNAKVFCRIEWEGESRDAAVLDLSLSGAMVSTQSGPPRGSKVTLHVLAAELGRPISISGTVVRGGTYRDDIGSPNRYGIRFDGPGPDVLKLMSAILGRKRPA